VDGIQSVCLDNLELTGASSEFNQSIHELPRYKLSQENLSRKRRDEWCVVGSTKVDTTRYGVEQVYVVGVCNEDGFLRANFFKIRAVKNIRRGCLLVQCSRSMDSNRWMARGCVYLVCLCWVCQEVDETRVGLVLLYERLEA
jgi:hypothetical protein